MEYNGRQLAPSAKISIDSANTWAGEIITLNASESHDLDGMVMNYYWQWQSTNGELMASNGKIIDIVGNGEIAVSLTVEDDLGATAETTTTIQTTQGPSVSSLQAANDGSNVVLEWEWQGLMQNSPSHEMVLKLVRFLKTNSRTNQYYLDQPIIQYLQ